jgi:fucose 4-O-acetylase-like acetyltransferase
MRQREIYIDRLRSLMTVLVLMTHTAITYGAVGGWFYYEGQRSAGLSGILLSLFSLTNQAYYMGFFFLLAGYFAPASLERKGYTRFIGDRLLRLGVPLLVFVITLGPVTTGMVAVAEGKGFWTTIEDIWRRKEFINGPLWFVEALLIFNLVYCVWRACLGSPLTQTKREAEPVPSFRKWLLCALAVGAAAITIRQVVPLQVHVFGLQLGYFAMYVFLFSVGIAAWRYDWLQQLRWANVRPWVITLAIAWPILPIAVAVVRSHDGTRKAHFTEDPFWSATLYAFWEPFIAWGIVGIWLLVFRAYMNSPSTFWSWLDRRAYAVYVIHAPILVGISLSLRNWELSPMIKVILAGGLTCLAAWSAADLLMRIPGVRRIV